MSQALARQREMDEDFERELREMLGDNTAGIGVSGAVKLDARLMGGDITDAAADFEEEEEEGAVSGLAGFEVGDRFPCHMCCDATVLHRKAGRRTLHVTLNAFPLTVPPSAAGSQWRFPHRSHSLSRS